MNQDYLIIVYRKNGAFNLLGYAFNLLGHAFNILGHAANKYVKAKIYYCPQYSLKWLEPSPAKHGRLDLILS